MYIPVARHAHLTGATPSVCSGPVPIPEGWAVRVEAIAHDLGDGVLEVHLETSNDLRIWTQDDPRPQVSVNTIGSGAGGPTGISGRYARLRFVLRAKGNDEPRCICGGGIRIEDPAGVAANSGGLTPGGAIGVSISVVEHDLFWTIMRGWPAG